MKNKKNLEHKHIDYFKIVWVSGIFLILILILLIVIKFKVYYEYNMGYLYFYENKNNSCDSPVCYTSNKKDTEGYIIYSKYHFNDYVPSVTYLGNNLLVLNNNVLYNYITGDIVTDVYDSYKIVGNNLIVSNSGKYGLINNEGKVLIKTDYIEMSSVDGIYLTVRDNKDSLYKLIDNNNKVIFKDYNYLYEYKNIVILVKDMILYIKDLKGTDLIDKKIDVYDKERLVSTSYNNNIIYINVYKGNQYYKYSYNIDSKEFKVETS